jgi:prefoldin subunit 5
MGLRTKVGWVLHGHHNTMRTLESLSSDLRALQAQVESLARSASIAATELRERQLAEFDSVRDAVTAATDDLGARIAVLQREASERT